MPLLFLVPVTSGLPLIWGCNLWLIGNILLCLPFHNLSPTSLLLSHTVSDSAFVTSLLPLAEHSQFSFLMEQWHSCNPPSSVDPHQVLECWIFHHCRIERTVCEHLMALRSHFITRLNRLRTRKLYSLLQRYTHSSTVLVCTLYWPQCMKAKTIINLLFVYTDL